MKRLIIVISILLLSVFFYLKLNKIDNWVDFLYPTIEFVDEDKVSEGSQIFHQLVPNPDSLFNSCILNVCNILYQEQSEIPVKKLFKFNLRNTQGVAATGGDSTTIDMFLNTNYITGFYNNHDKSDEETLLEITGIIIHELTHAYQHSPKGAGAYVNRSEHFSCVEGMADATRLKAGYISSKFRKPGGHWNDGYKTTAFFIDWMSEQDDDFIYKMNQSTLTIIPWTWNKATSQILGKPVLDLWIAYQKFVKPNGTDPVANFSTADTISVTYNKIVFTDKSTEEPFDWKWTFEGGIPSVSNERNPAVVYNAEGKYSVKLTIVNAFGSDSILKTDYVVIDKNPAGILISDLESEVVSQYSDSPNGEDVSKLFDNNSSTKYLTFNNSSWLQFACKSNKKYFLNKYSLVSANDSPQRDPKSIVLKGSNNGENWTIIDKRENIAFTNRHQTLDFNISNNNAFSYYRFELANHSGSVLQLADIQLFGKPKV